MASKIDREVELRELEANPNFIANVDHERLSEEGASADDYLCILEFVSGPIEPLEIFTAQKRGAGRELSPEWVKAITVMETEALPMLHKVSHLVHVAQESDKLRSGQNRHQA